MRAISSRWIKKYKLLIKRCTREQERLSKSPNMETYSSLLAYRIHSSNGKGHSVELAHQIDSTLLAYLNTPQSSLLLVISRTSTKTKYLSKVTINIELQRFI